jgi:hypothetical protein
MRPNKCNCKKKVRGRTQHSISTIDVLKIETGQEHYPRRTWLGGRHAWYTDLNFPLDIKLKICAGYIYGWLYTVHQTGVQTDEYSTWKTASEWMQIEQVQDVTTRWAGLSGWYVTTDERSYQTTGRNLHCAGFSVFGKSRRHELERLILSLLHHERSAKHATSNPVALNRALEVVMVLSCCLSFAVEFITKMDGKVWDDRLIIQHHAYKATRLSQLLHFDWGVGLLKTDG